MKHNTCKLFIDCCKYFHNNLMKMPWLLRGWDWLLVVGRELPNRGSSEKAGEWGSCVQTIICPQAHRQAPQVNQWGNARPTEDEKGGGGVYTKISWSKKGTRMFYNCNVKRLLVKRVFMKEIQR